jgi:hypothetical protein
VSEEYDMKLQVRSTSVALVAGAMFAVALVSAPLVAQKKTAADVAAKFTGTWVMKTAPAGAGPARPLYEVGFFAEFQGRNGGGRSGGAPGGGMDAGERAGQAALTKLQQLGRTVTIKATAESVTFTDGNGERTYATNNQNVKTDLGDGATLTSKSRWDGNTLKQQFIFGETSITQNWELSDDGNQINFKMQILNMSNQLPPKEAKVTYDRQAAAAPAATPAAQ